MKKLEIEKFKDSQIPGKVIEEIISTVHYTSYKEAFRAIKHDSSIKLSANDFLPTFLQANGKMKGNKGDYGLSLFDTEENIKNFVNSINGLRKSVKYIAKGKIDSKKGITDKKDNHGHFQFYLFDPIKMNPASDFEYHIQYEYKKDDN